MANNSVKVTVVFYKSEDRLGPFGLLKDPEEKSFKSVDDCIAWCRRNAKKIFSINDKRTFGQPVSHFDILDAINMKGD